MNREAMIAKLEAQEIALVTAMKKVLAKKTMDYNASRIDDNFRIDDAREEYYPFGDKSYAQMFHTKYLRIMNLLKAEGDPNFESLDDSIIDVTAYLCFWYSYRQRAKLQMTTASIPSVSQAMQLGFSATQARVASVATTRAADTRQLVKS